MKTRRRLAAALLGLLALDWVVVLVTGGWSPLQPGGDVSPRGMATRAIALGVLLLLRFRLWADDGRRMGVGRLTLLLLLLPALVQLHGSSGKLSGDGTSYYVFLRSLVKDRDFDLANEYDHFGMLSRWDLKGETNTGLRRSIYSVGPAVVWIPPFAVGEIVARLRRGVGGKEVDLSGYGPDHVNAVALGNVLYGFAGLLLLHSLLRRHFGEAASLGAVLLVWGATFFHWYLVIQPTYAHSPSFFLAAYAIWLWDRDRTAERGAWAFFYLGLVLGLSMCVRWQNGVFLALPAVDLVLRFLRKPGALPGLVGKTLLLGTGLLIGAFPQMAAWKALYDLWLLSCPPQGCDFVRLDHPWLTPMLFSSRHGLLSWTPVFWAGYLGFVPLLRRRPALAGAFLVPLAVMTYVNACVGDWWGGSSFSNRRFDSLLPLFAFGFAATIEALSSALRRRPDLGLAVLLTPAIVWAFGLEAQVREGRVRDDQVATFASLVGGGARLVSERAGFPTTWPASWVFAWRHRLSPARYDLLVGRYLFYRQNKLGGSIALSADLVDPMLDGFGPVEAVVGVPARCAARAGRFFVPLDEPEPLELRFRAVSVGSAGDGLISVNGRPLGRIPVGSRWTAAALRAPRHLWRRELNEVRLAPEKGAGPLCVETLDLLRTFVRGRRQ